MNTNHTIQPKRSMATGILGAGVLALCLQAAGVSHASPARQTAQAGDGVARTVKKSRSSRIKPQQNHSGESTAERDRRLYRECQGLPNAGACLGYTRR
ncbi:MAG: hypothetical protein JSS31_01480 [Proteobacteria bacterium]|nr:hypothetical protein [Pseudomonadota bacterium]MBS0492622.1 hypothetical protein [Pseudomonadota bacterium]